MQLTGIPLHIAADIQRLGGTITTDANAATATFATPEQAAVAQAIGFADAATFLPAGGTASIEDVTSALASLDGVVDVQALTGLGLLTVHTDTQARADELGSYVRSSILGMDVTVSVSLDHGPGGWGSGIG